MLKLPEQYRRTYDTSVDTQGAWQEFNQKSAALAAINEGVQNIVGQVSAKKENQALDAVRDTERELEQWRSERDYVTADDLRERGLDPEKYGGTTKVYNSQTKQFEDSEVMQYHMDEVYPDLYDSVMGEAARLNLEHIPSRHRSKEFTDKVQNYVKENAHSNRITANQRLIKRYKAEDLADAQSAIELGDYEDAREIFRTMPNLSDEERRDMTFMVDQAEELSTYQDILNRPATTMEEVLVQEAAARRLREDPEKSGSKLAEDVRLQLANMLQKKAEENVLSNKYQEGVQTNVNFMSDMDSIRSNPAAWSKARIDAQFNNEQYGATNDHQANERKFRAYAALDAANRKYERSQDIGAQLTEGTPISMAKTKDAKEERAAADDYFKQQINNIVKSFTPYRDANGNLPEDKQREASEKINATLLEMVTVGKYIPSSIRTEWGRAPGAGQQKTRELLSSFQMVWNTQEGKRLIGNELFNDKSYEKLEDINALTSTFMSYDEAYATVEARQTGDAFNKAAADNAKEQFRASWGGKRDVWQNTATEYIRKIYGDDDLLMSNSLKAHFETLVEAAIDRGYYDVNTAVSIAIGSLAQNKFGPQDFTGGKQIVPNPTYASQKDLHKTMQYLEPAMVNLADARLGKGDYTIEAHSAPSISPNGRPTHLMVAVQTEQDGDLPREIEVLGIVEDLDQKVAEYHKERQEAEILQLDAERKTETEKWSKEAWERKKAQMRQAQKGSGSIYEGAVGPTDVFDSPMYQYNLLRVGPSGAKFAADLIQQGWAEQNRKWEEAAKRRKNENE